MDNRTVSGTNMQKEQAYFDTSVIEVCTRNAIETAFTTEEIKAKLGSVAK